MRRRSDSFGEIRLSSIEEGQTAIGVGRMHGRAARRFSGERDKAILGEAVCGDEDA